jgi:hypothetical protein
MYINARQQESVMTNLSSWITQGREPQTTTPSTSGRRNDEWVETEGLDRRRPARAHRPRCVLNGNGSHQVVACGYREGKGERWIITYDPNKPGRPRVRPLTPQRTPLVHAGVRQGISRVLRLRLHPKSPSLNRARQSNSNAVDRGALSQKKTRRETRQNRLLHRD